MEKLISIVSRIWFALAVGGVTYLIFRGFTYLVLDQMKVNGIVMERDYQQADVVTSFIGLVVFFVGWKASRHFNK